MREGVALAAGAWWLLFVFALALGLTAFLVETVAASKWAILAAGLCAGYGLCWVIEAPGRRGGGGRSSGR